MRLARILPLAALMAGLALADSGEASSLGGASGRIRIDIDRDGIHRVTHSMLAASGADLSALPMAELRLMARAGGGPAREVAIGTHDENADGLLSPGDWFWFWGVALVDDVRPTAFQRGDFSDVNAYFLDALAGQRSRVTSRDAAPDPGSPLVTEFLETVRAEQETFFLANHRTGLGGIDHFYWCPSLVSPGPAASRVESVALPGLVMSGSLRAAVRARLLGRTSFAGVNPDHAVEVLLGPTLVTTASADGTAIIDASAEDLDATLLSDPLAVTLRLPGVAGADPERCELDWIEVDYPRTLATVDDRLDFHLEAPARVSVGNLASIDVTLLDVTDPFEPVLLTGVAPAGGRIEFELGGAGTRHVAVAGNPPGEPSFVPRAVAWIPESRLRDPSLAVDLLVIAPAAWVDPPLLGVERYVSWREAEGLRVRLVSTEEVFDEFNDGAFSPFAISDLLAFALNNWAVAPRWCLLLGDANVDTKNVLQGRNRLASDCSDAPDPCSANELGWAQHVPTLLIDNPADQVFLGYFASDAILAMVTGPDWMPDVALGRLPARSGPEAEALLDKVVAYEQLASAPPAWLDGVFTVGDEVAPGQQIIEQSQDDAIAANVPACYPRTSFYYQRDYGAVDPGSLTADLLAAWSDENRGAGVISYVGHGNTFNWSGSKLLTNWDAATCRDDVPSISGPGDPMPIVLNADCVAGGFMHLVGPSLLEELVRAPQGGAIAAFGPTGITDLSFAGPIVDAFYSGIHGPDGRGLRLGDVILGVQGVLSAFAAAGSPEELLSNVLLGDPSLRLAIPFGPPALGFAATAGDTTVTLAWDPVPGADGYAVQRSDDGLAGPWRAVATLGAGVTGFIDSGLENGRLYHHALEPLSGCHPGRWSRRVASRPCGPLAPEPASNVTIVQVTCDGQVIVSWNASPTSSIAGYVLRLHEAPAGGSPPVRVMTVTSTFAVLDALVPFQAYELVVNALSSCGIESSATPPEPIRATCPLVMNAPAFISDLHVVRDGATGLALTWGAITRDIQGLPILPSGYVVHAAPRADFLAEASTIADRVANPGSILPGRVGDGVTIEFFVVAAETVTATGGLGHDLPQGVQDLVRRDLDATTFELTWRPVTHDIRGERSPIVRHDVYASAAGPLTRLAVEALVPALSVTTSPATLDRALGPWHFVVAVDVHGNRSAW